MDNAHNDNVHYCRSDETQASQLIANVLRGGTKVVEKLAAQPVEREHNVAAPSDSNVRAPLPQIHFYGLAETQSQSDEIPGAAKSSLKPNETKRDTPAHPVSKPNSRDGKNKGERARPVVPPENASSRGDKQKRPLPNKEPAVPPRTLHAPRELRGLKRGQQKPLARQRSLSPSSDDSFAGPLPHTIREKRYMETSKNFQIPLSELGRSQDSCIEEDPDDFPASSSPVVPMYASLPQNRRSEPPGARPFPRGEILVVGTPSEPSQGSSLSALSQSSEASQPDKTSQDSEIFDGPHAQPQSFDQDFKPYTQAPPPPVRRNIYASDDDEVPVATQLSSPRYASTEPSSPYGRGDSTEVATQVATQVVEETTQPADGVPETGRLVTYPVESDIPQPPQTTPQQSTNAPKGLLSMVNPAKTWRFRGLQPRQRDVTLTEVQDSQLADEAALADLARRYNEAYSRTHTSHHATTDEPVRNRGNDGPHDVSDMDIVPDSEATQLINNPVSPVRANQTLIEPNVTEPAERQLDEGDEDSDEPLANRTLARNDSGQKMPPPVLPPLDTVPKLPPGIAAAIGLVPPSGSWETGVVPSSNPHLDHPMKARPDPKKSRSNDKSRATTPVVIPTGSSSHSHERQTPANAVPADGANSDSGCETEAADDDQMEVESIDELPTVASSRKRKRNVSSNLKGPISRSSTKTTKSNTPATRPSKRAKAGSVLRNGPTPTRVFALWKQDGHFYPGVVYRRDDRAITQYTINFDDGTSDVVEVSKMRICRLKQGDHVLINSSERAQVIDDTEGADLDTDIAVEMNRGGVRCRVPVQDIRIAARSITSQWKDRVVQGDDIVPVISKSIKTPTPSKHSLASVESIKGTRNLLANTGFVVSLSPGNQSRNQDKDRLVSSIKGNGGIVLEDWDSIFSMDGRLSAAGKRWVLDAEDVTSSRRDIDRVFLLSDDAHRTPKYLIALALGVPCLSLDWLEKVIAEVREQSLRLPQIVDSFNPRGRATSLGHHSFFLQATVNKPSCACPNLWISSGATVHSNFMR